MPSQPTAAAPRTRAPSSKTAVTRITSYNVCYTKLLRCSDVHERLTLYKRMANCETREALEALGEELIDRFGLLPEPARALLECHALSYNFV